MSKIHLNISPTSLIRHFETVSSLSLNDIANEQILHVLQWNILAQGRISIYLRIICMWYFFIIHFVLLFSSFIHKE